LGSKGAAWDSLTNSYVTPAPVGHYSIQNPFFLHERSARMLSITVSPDSLLRWSELNHPMALVFPVVYDSRYFGYVVTPHGSDSFFTEPLDTSIYDFVFCCKYRHTISKVYLGPILPIQSDETNSMFSMRGLSQFDKVGKSHPPDPGADGIPISMDIARRNRLTGMRSRWFNAYKIARGVRHSTFKIEPAPWIR
jgi:hypothetical protein